MEPSSSAWSSRRRTALLASAVLCLATASPSLAKGRPSGPTATWRAAWGQTVQFPGTALLGWAGRGATYFTAPTVANSSTFRAIARPMLSGSALRLRFSNARGDKPLVLAAVTVGVRQASTTTDGRTAGADVVKGTIRPVTFGHGKRSVTIAKGGWAFSDPVGMPVKAAQDLAVSMYTPTSLASTEHYQSCVAQYSTPAGSGDHTRDEAATSYSVELEPLRWLDAIEVLTPARRSVVIIGDSITDGEIGPMYNDDLCMDTYVRYPDVIARRAAEALGETGIVNQGFGGDSSAGVLKRLDHDVLKLSGVSTVIVEVGINDINVGGSAAATIANLRKIATKLRTRGVNVIGATLVPHTAQGRTPATELPTHAATHAAREEVNQFIRTSKLFNGVLDIAKTLGLPQDDDIFNPLYDSGDHLHPNILGYQAIGDALELALLK